MSLVFVMLPMIFVVFLKSIMVTFLTPFKSQANAWGMNQILDFTWEDGKVKLLSKPQFLFSGSCI